MLFSAQTAFMSSKVLELERPTGGNVSYTLQFLGPTLQCQDSNLLNYTYGLNDTDFRKSSNKFHNEDHSTYRSELRDFKKESYPTYRLIPRSGALTLQTTNISANFLGISPCPNVTLVPYGSGNYTQEPVARFMFAGNTTLVRSIAVRECTAAAAQYTVNISFSNGIQHISYSTGEKMPLQLETKGGEELDVSPMRSRQEYFNLLAIVNSFNVNFGMEGHSLDNITFNRSSLENPRVYNFPNGTKYEACTAEANAGNGFSACT
jgi:hypothetical protein